MTVSEKSVTRLQKIGLSEKLATHIAGKGVSSVMQLAGMSTAALSEMLSDADMGNDSVNGIKRRAAVMRSLVDNYLVTVRGQVSPAYKRLASTNTDNNIIDFHEGMDSYTEMFGDLDAATDPAFGSMIGPAAYLVDLMRYINEYIEQPPNPVDKALLLVSRRPDIWNIPLDAENTVDEVPYLALVNEILETKLNAEGKIRADGSIDENDKIDNALRYMAETIFPFNLPFNTPLEQIRKYLQSLKTDLYAIYNTFNIDVHAQAREYLKLSPEQASYLATPLIHRDSLNLAYGNSKTNNLQPHFTGIDDAANLGSLNNAGIFMNQTGFTQTSQLEDLFYQNIPTNIEGYQSNDLLNDLFINKRSTGYHLSYSPAETTGPDWAGEDEGEDPSYYSTMQRVVAGGELYLLVRTKKGMDTWKYNSSHNNWIRITAASPAWSDEGGWNFPQYYTTIQAVAANDAIYLFGRAAPGIETWKFDTTTGVWAPIYDANNSVACPPWSDTSGWNQPGCYLTIRSAFIYNYIFLIGRSPTGIETWFYDIVLGLWLPLLPGPSNPDWSDANGWNIPDCYLTINLTRIGSNLCLTGRSTQGMLTYVIYFVDEIPLSWLPTLLGLLGADDPAWDDLNGWNQPYQYLTIQICIVGDMPYLIGCDGKGISIWNMWIVEDVFIAWVPLLQFNEIPNWNETDWQNPANYLTLKTIEEGGNILFTGRSASGIQTWQFSLTDFRWSLLIANSPDWSDAKGWNAPSYYSSIDTVRAGEAVLLVGCTKSGIETWRYNSLRQRWVKDVLIKAVIQLENNARYAPLSLAALDLMNRFIRLTAILGWSYEDVDWAFIAAGEEDITTKAIEGIKNLQWIMDTLELTVWQATSFWHEIKTYGVGATPVSQAPFDIVFNQPMPFVKNDLVTLNDPFPGLYHPLYKPDPNYLDEPLVWETDGRSAGSHAIIVRLMGALNLDARDLKALADYFKGSGLYRSSNEMILTVENMSILYRYALLTNSLRLSISDLLILLELLGCKKLTSFKSDEVIRIIECSRWMAENRLNVFQLNYICNTVISKTVDKGFDLGKAPDLLKSLSEAAAQWYVNAKQLQFEQLMTEPVSQSFYNTLAFKNYIDDRGIILKNEFSFPKISDLLVCEELPFADKNQLIDVCSIGKDAKNAASIISIPFNPNGPAQDGTAWNGAVCVWFNYDPASKGICTLYSLFNSATTDAITLLQLKDGNLVLTDQNLPPQVLYNMQQDSPWNFLIISYAQRLVSLNGLFPLAPILSLQVPPGIDCAIAIGESEDTFITRVAGLRLFDGTITAREILDELYYTKEPPIGPLKGNSNYWPLNEGQGAATAKDVAGDINGAYAIATPWNITYNVVIPPGFNFLNKNGNLTKDFDPADTAPGSQPFIDLWKTITNLRNILNKTISIQKQGTLQMLSDYYRVNKDLSAYTDYIAKKDGFPRYIQTLLAYRFSLSWIEFSLDLDRKMPFISSYLINQFAANKIVISGKATITRLTNNNNNLTDKWMISQSATDVFFIDRRNEGLDIYKLLPDATTGVFPAGYHFSEDKDFSKFNIDKTFSPQRPSLYFSERDDQFAVLIQRGAYVQVVAYDIPGSGKDVVTQISSFLSDLGQLLFAVKTLKLSDAEFACIANNKDRFFTGSAGAEKGIFSLSQLKDILLFKRLNDEFENEDLSFVNYFYMADDMGSLVNYVAKLTQWDAQGLRQLSEWNCPYEQFDKIGLNGKINPSTVSVGAGSNYAIAGYPLSNAVFVYQLKGDTWEALPGIVPPGNAGSFGASVAIQNYVDGENTELRAIVADTSANSGEGVVYVYKYNKTKRQWDQSIVSAPDAAAGNAFGASVSISKNTMIIGAPNAGVATSGKAYLFNYQTGRWTDQGINFPVQTGDTLFGSSLSLSDDIAAVASANNAYIFTIENSTATQVTPPVPCIGAKVVTNGDFVVMAGITGGKPVIVYITDISSATPSKVCTLTGQGFTGASAIAIEEDTLIVNDSTNTCFVYYIQDNILAFRNSFKLSAVPATVTQPCPIALSDGNLAIGVTDNLFLLFFGTKHDVNWFGFVLDCFNLADTLGVSIGFLLGFIGLARLELDVRCDNPSHAPSPGEEMITYSSYEGYAAKLASALTIGRTPEEWDTIYDPLRNKFLEKERDALAGYMIFSLRHVFTDITGIDDLYELLLTDVGSGGCRTISRLKSALNSLQLYIERCQMQLEPYASVKGSAGGEGDGLNAAGVEWSWMKNYTLWAANREVFLFPENYYDPTLRKDKTAPYADLQNKLCQSNLTNDNATTAFQAYFHDLETLTGLVVVSACMGRVASFVNGRIMIKNTYFIFAKTKNRNEGFYYRMADAILPADSPDAWVNWTNWQKIEVSMVADAVTAVYAGGRVYLFWLDYTKQQVTGDGNTFSSDKTFYYVTNIYYTFQNSNGQWANPHEAPDPKNALDFTITPSGEPPAQVAFPPNPAITFLNAFLDVADLSISITVTGGTPPSLRLSIPIDNILNLYERYMWAFNGNATDLRAQLSLGNGSGVGYISGNDLFANRKVLSLSDYTGGLAMPSTPVNFNTWFNDSFTLGIWVNGSFPAGATASWPILYSTPPASPATPDQFSFQIINGFPSFGVGTQILNGNVQLQNNSWYFIVFRYNAKTVEQAIFVNGILDNRDFYPYRLQGNAQFLLGYNGSQAAVGCMADLFVIHSPLPDTEVFSIYEQYINFEISDDVDNYEWQLDGDFNELQQKKGDALIPSSASVLFQPSAGVPFGGGREVLALAAANKQYIALPGRFNTFLHHSFSIGIWISGTFPTSGDWPILASSALTPGESFCVLIRNGAAYFDFYNSSTVGNKQLSPSAWYFLVFTYDEDSQTQSIFVDGAFDASTGGHLAYTGGTTLNLGLYNNEYANGQLANLFLTDTALSASDVLALYTGTVDPNVNPVPADNTAALRLLQSKNAVTVQQFSEDLFMGGADYLYAKNSVDIGYSSLSSKAPYGKYMWELFYHIPMLIGQLLCSNRKFEDAKKWYEYIFNPLAADKSNDRYWQLGYFRSIGKPEDLVTILTDSAQNNADQVVLYDLDPFDPEAIAYLRPGAFEKKTVIKYIDNLLAWGDSLFSQYTWETITQAEMLSLLAKELLGKKPDITGSFVAKTPMTLSQIEEEYPYEIPQFVIDIEDKQPAIHPGVQNTPPLSASVANFYFGIPENDEIPAYQNLAQTRLFEIRNCLNIMGQRQSLALFEPPINPMMLVAAGAAGLRLADVPISYAADIPHFRFTSIIGYAKSVAERVAGFGGQIISALEKNDEELLAVLRITQEKTILDLTTSIKEKEIESAMDQALVLDQSLASANERVAYYNTMLAKPVSDLEAMALQYNQVAIAVEIPATALHVAAVVGHLIPTVYGFADGDFSPGGSIESAAAALSSGSGIANNISNMTAVSASYSRRQEDWGLQLKMAQYDVTSIGIQKKINAIQLQNAMSELAIQHRNITNNQDLQNFYADKFTNKELYQWMIDQVSSVYYQAFQMAVDLAKKAEIAYQFELNTNESYISYGYWDNTRRGLLAGEKLISDLGALEKAYIDNYGRSLEIQKIISLKDISITELNRLIATGTCKISLSEQLFDRDFPGHYNRKIKSVSITIPAIVGPYQSVKATLVQQSNKVVTQPDLATVKYLVSKQKQPLPSANYLRVNWRPKQQIVISKASGDSGLFELNFNDERYLPFEGTGVVSDWQLSIPQATNAFELNTISDVILYIDYTAEDGGEEFGQQVFNLPEIKKYDGVLVVSIRQQFNKTWNTFMTTGTATFSIANLQFPPNLAPPVSMDEKNIISVCKTISGDGNGIHVNLTSDKKELTIVYDDPKRAELLDIILEIPYSAELRPVSN